MRPSDRISFDISMNCTAGHHRLIYHKNRLLNWLFPAVLSGTKQLKTKGAYSFYIFIYILLFSVWAWMCALPVKFRHLKNPAHKLCIINIKWVALRFFFSHSTAKVIWFRRFCSHCDTSSQTSSLRWAAPHRW